MTGARIPIQIKAEIRGTAHSSYDESTIDRRLAVLRGRWDAGDETRREIEFLEDLKRHLAGK